jgi:hypothetical protein
MTEFYLEVTYRHGQPRAAYLYLSYKGPRIARWSRRVARGLIIDARRMGGPSG